MRMPRRHRYIKRRATLSSTPCFQGVFLVYEDCRFTIKRVMLYNDLNVKLKGFLKMTDHATTCQICGRPIKANTGKIAHHGYRRPGDGWQTSSCYGARHLPYEVSCAALQAYIPMVETALEARSEWLKNHIVNPPAEIRYEVKSGSSWNPKYEWRTAECPEGYDYERCRQNYSGGIYHREYSRLKRGAEAEIAAMVNQLDYLRERLAEWKAPEAE